jgi:hypothetical protein
VVSLLSYFVCMIIVLAAAVGAMIGLFNFSTSERASHTPHPRPALERDVTATNSEPRLFMSVPDTKDASPAKNNLEAKSVVAPEEKAEEAKTHKPHNHKPHNHKAIARKRNDYEQPSYGNATGYAEEYRNGPQRLWSNW